MVNSIRQHTSGHVSIRQHESADEALAAGQADAVAWGRLFIANPDLPRRFQLNAALNEPQPETFYGQGPVGYVDYPSLPAA
jgi:2,4-dienoyl-CoA reductase-like NADH-dependent reductase (Old Yellow Enzyme family)